MESRTPNPQVLPLKPKRRKRKTKTTTASRIGLSCKTAGRSVSFNHLFIRFGVALAFTFVVGIITLLFI
jgi:hypothetical protein